MKPVIGIVCCSKPFGEYRTPNHAVSDTYVRATSRIADAVPLLIPADQAATDLETLLARIDGLLLTGSRSNVQPSLYGGPPHPDGTPEDPARDDVAMTLIRAAIGRRMPLLAICRGLQELNVALGGTLHQRLADLDGRLDHATPDDPDHAVRTGKRHTVGIAPGGMLAALGADAEIEVNSLHDQGIARLADGLAIEATASDGTIEAVRLAVPGLWGLGVQWHPEYDHRTDPVSRSIFVAFGAAVRGTEPDPTSADRRTRPLR